MVASICVVQLRKGAICSFRHRGGMADLSDSVCPMEGKGEHAGVEVRKRMVAQSIRGHDLDARIIGGVIGCDGDWSTLRDPAATGGVRGRTPRTRGAFQDLPRHLRTCTGALPLLGPSSSLLDIIALRAPISASNWHPEPSQCHLDPNFPKHLHTPHPYYVPTRGVAFHPAYLPPPSHPF